MKTKYTLLTRWLLGATLLLCALSAQADDTIEDGRYWLNVNATGPLPFEGWRWYAELQPRWRDEGRHLDQLLIRPAVAYSLSKQASVWLGYGHITTHPAGKAPFEENRLWQQYLYNFDPVWGINVQSRTRLEERFLENSSDTGYKLRQLVRLTKPSG